MAVKKKRPTHKSKKKIVRKHKNHTALEKKVEEKELQAQEARKEIATPAEAPISESVVSESVGSPVVVPSSVPEEAPKEQQPQSEPQKSETTQSQPQPQPLQPPEQQSQPQLLQQTTDALLSQPESAINTAPNTEVSQDTSSFSGVVRDKPEPDQEDLERSKKKRSWILIAIITVGIVLIGGALWYFRENVIKKSSIQDKITSVPIPLKNTPTPASDSAKLEIDFSKYKIKVLNGSGIRGEAARVKELLEAEEFLIEEIGNAGRLTYEKTVIQAKKEVPNDFLDKLKGVLEQTYLLDSSEELEDSEEMNVVIIIGSSKQP